MRDDDLEILQELFDSEPAVKALGAPIGLRAAASCCRLCFGMQCAGG